jgi:hypothetical protein
MLVIGGPESPIEVRGLAKYPSHGGSQGFKSPHLHPITALVTGLAGPSVRPVSFLSRSRGQQTGSKRPLRICALGRGYLNPRRRQIVEPSPWDLTLPPEGRQVVLHGARYSRHNNPEPDQADLGGHSRRAWPTHRP